jgi:hypothetical protein
MDEWRLKIGNRLTGIVVWPDSKWPGMWRIHAPDGRISDMVNLSRAKDAAISWARPRGLGGKEIATWDRRESPAIGVRNGLKPTDPGPDAQTPLPAFPGAPVGPVFLPRGQSGAPPTGMTGCTGPASTPA